MDGPRDYHTKSSKSDRERQYRMISLIIEIQKNDTNEFTYKEKQTHRLRKQTYDNIPKKKKCRKARWFSEKALQIAEMRIERQGRKGKLYATECRIP